MWAGAVDRPKSILNSYDAVVLCCGAKKARDLNVPGRDANGVHFAVDYLTSVTKSLLDSDFADGRAIDAQRARTSWSSAAATPATTARARPCGRAAPTWWHWK